MNIEMSKVIRTDLFDALQTMDYIIIQRDKAWAKYMYYQPQDVMMASGWLQEWQRCNSALTKIQRDYPSLKKIYETNRQREKEKGKNDGRKDRRKDRS